MRKMERENTYDMRRWCPSAKAMNDTAAATGSAVSIAHSTPPNDGKQHNKWVVYGVRLRPRLQPYTQKTSTYLNQCMTHVENDSAATASRCGEHIMYKKKRKHKIGKPTPPQADPNNNHPVKSMKRGPGNATNDAHRIQQQPPETSRAAYAVHGSGDPAMRGGVRGRPGCQKSGLPCGLFWGQAKNGPKNAVQEAWAKNESTAHGPYY